MCIFPLRGTFCNNLPGNLVRHSVPGILLRGLSHGNPLCNMHKKQVFNVNHIVYRKSLDTVGHSLHLGKVLYQCRGLFSSQVDRHQPRDNLGSKLFSG